MTKEQIIIGDLETSVFQEDDRAFLKVFDYFPQTGEENTLGLSGKATLLILRELNKLRSDNSGQLTVLVSTNNVPLISALSERVKLTHGQLSAFLFIDTCSLAEAAEYFRKEGYHWEGDNLYYEYKGPEQGTFKVTEGPEESPINYFVDDPCVKIHMCSDVISFLMRWFPSEHHPLAVVETVLSDRIKNNVVYNSDGSIYHELDIDNEEWGETELYVGTLYSFDKERDYVATDINATIHCEGNYGVGEVEPTLQWTVKPEELPKGYGNEYGVKVWVWDEVNPSPEEHDPFFGRLIVVGFYNV